MMVDDDGSYATSAVEASSSTLTGVSARRAIVVGAGQPSTSNASWPSCFPSFVALAATKATVTVLRSPGRNVAPTARSVWNGPVSSTRVTVSCGTPLTSGVSVTVLEIVSVNCPSPKSIDSGAPRS